jgi:hypothetical protein
VALHLHVPQEDIAGLRKSKRLAILLDGCDEVSDLDRNSVITLLSSADAITSRDNFYELRLSGTTLVQRFQEIIRLAPLSFDEIVRKFVRACCNLAAMPDRADPLIRVLNEQDELRDLVSRPLLLIMTVDVLDQVIIELPEVFGATEEVEIPTGRPRWGAEVVYRLYTRKWLLVEAARAPRLFDWTDKERLVRIAARAIFLRQGVAGPAATRDVTELAVSRVSLIDAVTAAGNSGEIADLTSIHRVGVMVDELCHRTFLILSTGLGDEYRFVHKSFLEFYVALDLWLLCQTAGEPDHPRQRAALKSVTAVLARPLPDEVVRFFREMLERSRSKPPEQSSLSAGLFEVFARSAALPQPRSRTVRQHAGNLLTHIANRTLAEQLREIAENEADPFVRRGLIVGLAMNHGYVENLNEYVAHLRADDQAARIQVGYTRIYHGDQLFEGNWFDDGTQPCERTIREMVLRLRRRYHPMLWSLTLFTLNYLFESGRGHDLLLADGPERRFLLGFLIESNAEAGSSFESERLRLRRHLLDPAQPNSSRHPATTL